MKRGVTKGGRGGKGNTSEENGCEGASCFTATCSAECDGEHSAAMQIYCPVCLAASAAEERKHEIQEREEQKIVRERQGQNGNETQEEREQNRGRESDEGKERETKTTEGGEWKVALNKNIDKGKNN